MFICFLTVGGGIAFTVYLDHDMEFGPDQTVKFNKVISHCSSLISPGIASEFNK